MKLSIMYRNQLYPIIDETISEAKKNHPGCDIYEEIATNYFIKVATS